MRRLVRIESHFEESELWVLTDAPGYVIQDAINDANAAYEEGCDWDISFENSIKETGEWCDEIEFIDAPETYYMD